MAAWSYAGELHSNVTLCEECNCELVMTHHPPSEVTCYTRQGTIFLQSFTTYCRNRHCGRKYCYGYTEKNGLKTYQPFNETTKYLLISANTAFEISYLFEVTLHFLFNAASFQGICSVYNTFHKVVKDRSELYSKRLTEAWFLYSFLEMSQRNGISPEFSSGEKWIDQSILDNESLLRTCFSQMWMKHKCDIPQCASIITTDGGMKIHRATCSAKFSAVKFCKHSETYQLTGCTRMPTPTSPFCSEHQSSESQQPVIPAEKLSKKTRNKLNDYQRKSNKSFLELPCDSVYIVEKILNSKKTSSGLEYLIKFSGFPESQSCYEPKENLPQFIQDYYSVKENLSKCLPAPYIVSKKTLQNGSEEIFYLDWHKKSKEQFTESLFDINNDVLDLAELRQECNTRKMKDKRERRHTCGTLISSFQCGTIPHLDELPLSEGIRTVHSSITTFLGTLPKEIREEIKIHFYDDQCHLKYFSEQSRIADKTDITEFFSKMTKAVDRFHFKSHKKTDQYCQTQCNPEKVLKEMGISHVNTQSCEESFVWINKMTHLKTMNEARHKFFLLYVVDLHNLHIARQMKEANPNENRNQSLRKISSIKMTSIDELTEKMAESSLKSIPTEVSGETFEDCFDIVTEESNVKFKCKFCGGIYQREGHFRNHLNDKHNLDIKITCSCGKVFATNTKLNRHKKTCSSK